MNKHRTRFRHWAFYFSTVMLMPFLTCVIHPVTEVEPDARQSRNASQAQ